MSVEILIFLSLTSSVQGYTKFSTNCSTPTTSIFNFVTTPNARGTLDILWSSLFTIFACSWTVLHLNVPEQREDHNDLNPNWKVNLKWNVKGFLYTFRWCMVMIFAPEVLLAKYWTEYGWVKSDHKILRELAEKDGVPWTKTHTFFTNIGGFAVKGRRYGDPEDPSLGTHSNPSAPLSTYPGFSKSQTVDDSLPAIQQEFSAVAEKWTEEPFQAGEKHLQYRGTYIHLITDDIIQLRKAKILPSLPYITVDEINDKNKSDAFVQAIAICQLLSTIIQILIRALRRLAVSQLEVAVVAFALCAIMVYGLNWSKPQGVKIPIVILNYSTPIPDRVLKYVARKDHIIKNTLHELVGDNLFACLNRSRVRRLPGHPISNLMGTSDSPSSHITTDVMGLFIGSVVFGGIHVFAWNFTFPTKYEQMAWRVASTFCAGVIPAFILFAMLMCPVLVCFDSLKYLCRRFYTLLEYLIPPLYVLGRLFMIVEMFRCLLYLPPSAYVSIWASNIPQVG